MVVIVEMLLPKLAGGAPSAKNIVTLWPSEPSLKGFFSIYIFQTWIFAVRIFKKYK